MNTTSFMQGILMLQRRRAQALTTVIYAEPIIPVTPAKPQSASNWNRDREAMSKRQQQMFDSEVGCTRAVYCKFDRWLGRPEQMRAGGCH